MTESNRDAAARSLHVSFDGAEVTLSSNDPTLLDAMARIFGPALVGQARNSVGHVRAMRDSRGFTIETNDGKADVIDTIATLPDHLKRVVHGYFVRARSDLLWLHAGVVAREQKATLLLGESGQGKSTLSTKLVTRGWSLLSDDTAAIRSDNDVLPYYQLPSRRVPVNRELSASDLRNAAREVVPIPIGSIERSAMPVVRNIFVKYTRRVAATIVPLSTGEAALSLLHHSVNFHHGHEASLKRVTDLVQGIDSFALEYSDSDLAADIIAS